MYTKKIEHSDKRSLLYRDKIKFDSNVSIDLKQNESKLTIRSKNATISLVAGSIEKILKFYDLIRPLNDARKSQDSAFFEIHGLAAKSQDDVNGSFIELNTSDETEKSNTNSSPLDSKAEVQEEEDDEEDEWSSLANQSSEYDYNSIDSESEDEQKEYSVENSRFYILSD